GEKRFVFRHLFYFRDLLDSPLSLLLSFFRKTCFLASCCIFMDKTFSSSSVQFFNRIFQKFRSVLFFIDDRSISFTYSSTHSSFDLRVVFVRCSALFYTFDCTFNVWHFIHLQFQVRQECFPISFGYLFTT